MMKIILLMLSYSLMIYLMNNYKLIIHNYILMLTPIMLMNLNLNNLYWSKIYYIFGLDVLSMSLMMLSSWIIPLALMANYKLMLNKFWMNFIMITLTLLIILMLCFMTTNLIMFYILFEASLIPMIMIIMGWGMQIDRIQASMYMLFYTLSGSMPLLIMLIYIFKTNDSGCIIFLTLNNSIYLNNLFFYIMMMIALIIKMPMYLTHIWLPQAHVEAPISGSMILAGIMLKLGSYGIYRMLPMMSMMNSKFNYILLSVSLMGSIYSSLICLNQTDMKIIVAYSSVVHMNILLAGMLTFSNWSMTSSIWTMMAHGLCSSAMFCLVNFNYERLHTRNLYLNKGLMNLLPSMTTWWFLVCSANFSAPPSLNLFGEILIINSLMSWSYISMMYIIFIMFYSTCYSIYLFSFTQHGKSPLFMPLTMPNIREFMILIMHWVPLNIMFINLLILT